MAYSPEQKAAAVAIIQRHGGLKNAALDEVEALLGKRISTSTLHGWLSKSGSDSESKIETPKPKTETAVSKAPAADPAPVETTTDDLSPQQIAFIDAYFRLKFNGTQSAIEAGYAESSAAVQASRLLRNDKVRAEIQRRLDGLRLGSGETFALMSEIAQGTMADFLSVDARGWRIDLNKAQKAGKLHLVKKIKERRDGTIELELYPKDAALRDIGKAHGLWKDGIEIMVDVNLITAVVEAIREAELDPSEVFNSLLVEIDHARRSDDHPESGPPGQQTGRAS